MTAVTATPGNLNGASRRVNAGLRRYAESLGSHKQVRRVLGPDVDPDYCTTDFLWSIAQRDERRLDKVYQTGRTKTALSVSAGGTSGGYLVPAELSLELMADVAEEAIVRPRATVVPMSSSTLLLPLPDPTAVQAAGTSPFFGGILMQWTAESAARPESEPAWRLVQLKAWELSGYALESNSMYADGGKGVDSYLRKLFARSIAWYEDYAYLTGNGVGKPQGIVNSPAAKQVTRQTGSQFTIQDVRGMASALIPASWSRAIWVVSVSVWQWLLQLNTTAWQVNQPMQEGPKKPHFTLNGQAGFVSEKLPAVGTQGDVVLFDPELYIVADRGAVEIDVSFDEPTAFLKNQMVWRVVYRGDGQPWTNKPLTLADGTTTASPFVVLV